MKELPKKFSSVIRMRPCFQQLLLIILLITFSMCGIQSQESSQWPGFHGHDRTNKSIETGLLKSWPAGGPEVLWTTSGLGKGYSSISIAEGTIFTSGMIDKQTYVFAFDMEGTLVWKKPNGQSWETEMPWATSYDGARSTPTFDHGIVYHLGELGRLTAFDSKTGKEIWSIELRERFDAEIPEYGYSESVFIEGDRLYCCPAGKKAYLVCLDKNNGDLIWSNNDINGNVGFGSLIMYDNGGYHQLAGLSSNSIFGVDAKTGELLWQAGFENSRSNNVTDPIYSDGYIFASSGYGKGSILIKLEAAGQEISPQIIWQTELMDNHHGGVILHDGYLYGAGHNARGWFCLEFMTGKEMWKSGGKGSLTFADQMLYCLDERGIMTLVSATPYAYKAAGSMDVPAGGTGMHWAHPVVCNGMLFIRHDDKLFAYDVSEK